MERARLRVLLERLLVGDDRFGAAPAREEQARELGVRLELVGVELDRPAEGGLGVVGAPRGEGELAEQELERDVLGSRVARRADPGVRVGELPVARVHLQERPQHLGVAGLRLEREGEVLARVVVLLPEAVDASDREVAFGAALVLRDREQAAERLVETLLVHQALRDQHAGGDVFGILPEGTLARLDRERVVAEPRVDARQHLAAVRAARIELDRAYQLVPGARRVAAT